MDLFRMFYITKGLIFLCFTYFFVVYNMFLRATYKHQIHIYNKHISISPLLLGLNGQLNEITSRILENRFFIIRHTKCTHIREWKKNAYTYVLCSYADKTNAIWEMRCDIYCDLKKGCNIYSFRMS